MNNREKHILKGYTDAVESLAQLFLDKYFPEQDYKEDCFWVGDRIGDVFHVNSYYFNVDRMREAIELDATYDQLIDYYDAEIDYASGEGDKIASFKNYIEHGILKIKG